MFGIYSQEHFFMSCPWPNAEFNENSQSGAFTAAASGLLHDCWSSSLCFFSSEDGAQKEEGERRWRRSTKDYLDFTIFIPLWLFSLSSLSFCLSVSLHPSNSFHLASSHPKSSHLDYPYRSECNWLVMDSFRRSLSLSHSLSLSSNLLHVHDTNTETDISSPASLFDIYHRAS